MIRTLLALAALLPQQQSQPPQPQQRSVILEGIAVQAGERLVTMSEFERVLLEYRRRWQPETRQDEERMFRQALRDMWTIRLEAQAGADLGLDPAQIERISRMQLAEDRESKGLQAYLSDVRAEGRDALGDESDKQEEILKAMWEYSALGYAVAGRRPTRDTTIRPGELRAIYEENKDRLDPATVQLRMLSVSSQLAGSPELARQKCEEARERALAGEDFEMLFDELGQDMQDSRGLTPFIVPERLTDPALESFAAKAEVGEISEVLPLTNPSTGEPAPEVGYVVAQLHERRVPPVPAFDAPATQRTLRAFYKRNQRERLLDRARDELRRESYGWINPILGGARPPRTPPQTAPPGP